MEGRAHEGQSVIVQPFKRGLNAKFRHRHERKALRMRRKSLLNMSRVRLHGVQLSIAAVTAVWPPAGSGTPSWLLCFLYVAGLISKEKPSDGKGCTHGEMVRGLFHTRCQTRTRLMIIHSFCKEASFLTSG